MPVHVEWGSSLAEERYDALTRNPSHAGHRTGMLDQDFEIVQPRAAAMVEALRAFGYSTQAALADLVDNSISAGATQVDVIFYWSGADSYIALLDNGHGMNAEELTSAMRPGSRNPLETRADTDLGRFGLGLKSASFSQCRRLTVASKKSNAASKTTRRWDLDYINRTSEWRLLKTASSGSEERLQILDGVSTGTVILWESMDRIVGDEKLDDVQAQKRFLDLAGQTERYLGMIFHRFLESNDRLVIRVNENPVAPWNPFLERHTATQWLDEEILPFRGERVRIQPFVLPHHSKMAREIHRQAAGSGGWNARQGFYVYRNRRLLVAGDWLGLPFTKEEHYKLARIRVDLPNTMDQEWQIDVRKSRARPPGVLRRDLERIARVTRERAVAIYRHRGKVVARSSSADHVFAWEKVTKHGKISYRVNREHPMVSRALTVPQKHRSDIHALLRLIEETVPTALIAIDSSERPGEHSGPFETSTDREVREVMMTVYRALLSSGLSRDEARNRISMMEAFSSHPELVASLDESLDEEQA